MNGPVLLVPRPTPLILFDDSEVDRGASCVSGEGPGMIQQLFPDAEMPVFREDGQVVQFALAIFLYAQRNIPAQDTVLFVDEHGPALFFQLP